MFHRRAARHAAGQAPAARTAPGRPISITPLAEGFMAQRPYAQVVLGSPRYRIHDLVVVTGSELYPTHIGRMGKVAAINRAGTVLPITVDFEDGGAAFFDPGDLRLLRTAPTAVLPKVPTGEPVVTVWHAASASIGAYGAADTLVLDAVADDMPLVGGAR